MFEEHLDTQLPNDTSMEWNPTMASLLGSVAVESRTTGQHGKEQTPRLVETVLSYNKDNPEDTAYYNHSVHRTHRDGDPGMQIF